MQAINQLLHDVPGLTVRCAAPAVVAAPALVSLHNCLLCSLLGWTAWDAGFSCS